MPLIPPETIEQVQNATDIVEVIGGYISLKRAAGVFKAICPFHQERTPSFTVNPKRQTFKCFGCGAGGSVFRFVMNYENLDFVGAVKKLAERAGIRIVEGVMSPEESAKYTMRRRLLALHAEATEFFHLQLLRKPSAQVARDYLKSRGISVEVAKSWKLGYAPDSYDAFDRFAHEQGFNDEEIVASGIVKLRDEEQLHGDYYDRFRARVMFPICNDNSEVIGFSGRVLDADAKTAKYLNSPETILFKKGAVLFGLHRSKRACIEKNSAIVCEGQLDLITAFEAGIQNVIAPQGTAFTEKQAHLLKRFVNEVVLCFDSDLAGEKAAERSLGSLLAENLIVRVAQMPPGEDPDSLIRGQGAEAFSKRINEAKDFFEFQVERVVSQPEFASARGKQEGIKKVAEAVSKITDGILRETVVNKASARLEVSAQEFMKILTTPKKEFEPELDAGPGLAHVAMLDDPTLRLLAKVVLTDDDARAFILEEAWNDLLAKETEAGLIIKILEAEITPSKPSSVGAFLTTLEDFEEAALAGLLSEKPSKNPVTIAQDCWRALERNQIQRRIKVLEARLRNPTLAAEDAIVFMGQIRDLRERHAQFPAPSFPTGS